MLHGMGQQSGSLFSRKLVAPKLHKFEDDFFTVLENDQATTKLIDDAMDM
jgi:hypothetical protein